MTPQQAADRLGLSVSGVYVLCRAGKIRHRRVGAKGGKILITDDDVAEYLASTEVAPRPETPAPEAPRKARPRAVPDFEIPAEWKRL